MPARTFQPPSALPAPGARASVFLAGSIDMGAAVDWQAALTARLADLDVDILNPRRDEWDASWVQRITNPDFRGQVEWELDGLDAATVIAMYLAADSKAPISLLELGLYARSGRLVVACPEGFYRRGNVEVVCARYGVPLVATPVALEAAVRARLA